MRRAALLLLMILSAIGIIFAAGTLMVTAQDDLLRNGGLDEGSFGPYTTRRGGDFPIYLPDGWNVWLAQQSGDFYNRADRTSINPHPTGGSPNVVQGNRALSIDCGYVTCTVAIYQQVSVQEGQNLTAHAWGQVIACNLAPNANKCASAIESGSQVRIGIDPSGGTDPGNGSIVWSNFIQPHDQWQEVSVSATAAGGTVSLFLYSTQANTADVNRTFWDGVSLKVGGEGGSVATPVPTAPPSVPFVVPQAPQPDGSLIHVVQPQDTIDSIAVAYGMSRAEVLALNPSITDPRIISLGQKIVIREAPENPTGGINLEAEVTEEASPGTAGPPPTPAPGETPAAPAETSEASPSEASSPEAEGTEDASLTLTPAPVVVAQGELSPDDLSALGGTVCVLLFEDTNQNRIQEPNESLLAGGSIQLASLGDSAVVGTVETGGVSEPHCFDDVAAGSYLVSAAAPQGYGLTSPGQLRLQAQAGTRLDVAFGAAQGVVQVSPPPADAGGTNGTAAPPAQAQASPLQDLFSISGLVIFGLAGAVLLGGIVLTIFLRGR